MAVPDIEFTSDPFLPGNVEDLMESGQFDSGVEYSPLLNASFI